MKLKEYLKKHNINIKGKDAVFEIHNLKDEKRILKSYIKYLEKPFKVSRTGLATNKYFKS